MRSVPISRLAFLRGDLDEMRSSALLDQSHYAYLMDCFETLAEQTLSGAASILILACPSPALILSICHSGRRRDVLLPPTFAERGFFEAGGLALLGPVLAAAGGSIAVAELPSKLLAAHTGLARIGRNRLAYVEGMGSCLRLAAFIADRDCGDDGWGEVAMPDACAACGACARACPSGAIGEPDRPLDYSRCLCHWNEEVEGAFPAWIQPAWHNALMGCLLCQRACPLNLPFLRTPARGPSFNEEETRAILESVGGKPIPEGLRPVLEACGLWRHRSLLGRNLRALLDLSAE